jgi:hypothetical protein
MTESSSHHPSPQQQMLKVVGCQLLVLSLLIIPLVGLIFREQMKPILIGSGVAMLAALIALRRHLFSTDHKVIGVQFLITSLVMLFVGGLLAMLIRWQLGWPGQPLPFMEKFAPNGMPGGVMVPEYYNMLFTMHGSIMIFFAIIPLLVGVFGNFLIPLKIGAADMAFPKINMISYWMVPPAIAIVCAGFFMQGGAAAAGWTSYAPLSAVLGPGQVCWILGVIVLGTSSRRRFSAGSTTSRRSSTCARRACTSSGCRWPSGRCSSRRCWWCWRRRCWPRRW